ncbi:MAG: vanadium-dependent haloperoxidase [Chryseolinea sp.]
MISGREKRSLPKRQPVKSTMLVVLLICWVGCQDKPRTHITPHILATTWATMVLYVTKNTPSNSPTYASRAFGYIGVTMYESVVYADSTYKSLRHQLNGLDTLPLPEPDASYNWELVFNASQSSILKNLYNQTSDANKRRIDSLELRLEQDLSMNVSMEVIAKSTQYGRALAEAIFKWSLTDGGHRGYLHNFDKEIQIAKKSGCWEPPLYGQSFSHFPLHPHWGDNRTFVKLNGELPQPAIISFDEGRSSSYYAQFDKVYQKSKSLTQADKEAAIWWSDDPSDTFTPPGHSFYIATLVLKQKKPTLIQCAMTYARVGMGVADSFINCWKWKYHHYSERPSSYIPKHIDERWESFWPDPPFPAFPSGHATQAGALAIVMIDLYGDAIAITDSAHVGRPRDELRNVDFKARRFNSLTQIANEIADSRFYGGIHTPQDNEVGLREGSKMGKNINQLLWRHEE